MYKFGSVEITQKGNFHLCWDRGFIDRFKGGKGALDYEIRSYRCLVK